MKRRPSAAATLVVPGLIAALSVVGIVAALTGEGWRDALSWAGLGVPVLAVAWAAKARRT